MALNNQLKRACKNACFKAHKLGLTDYREFVEENPMINITILEELYNELLERGDTSKPYMVLCRHIGQILKGYKNGRIKKSL